MKYLSIDRFEGQYAICEDSDQKYFAILINELPQGASETDVLRIEDDGTLCIDADETRRRKEKAASLQNKLLRGK